MNEVSAELLDDVMSYCNLTWEDERKKKDILDFIATGMSVLNDLAGSDQDYNIPGLQRQMLKDYVLYADNHAVSEFMKNYQQDILRLRMTNEIKVFEESEGTTQ